MTQPIDMASPSLDLPPFPAPAQAHSKPVRCVAFSSDSKWLASGSEDSTAKVWDIALVKCTRTLQVRAAECAGSLARKLVCPAGRTSSNIVTDVLHRIIYES